MSNFLEDPHPYYHSQDGDDLTEPAATEAIPGSDGFLEDMDDSVTESLIILGLAGALAFLLYYRQQRQTNHRREAAERQVQGAQAGGGVPPPVHVPEQPLPGQQPDGGFFPAPGDANFAQWVAGGVAH